MQTVTAIITTYNRSAYLVEALESLLAQTRPVDEIIVVDDASTDDTVTRLAPFANRVRLLRNAVNRGKPATLNAVIPQALGTHVWLFDDDDVALPDALARHLDCLTAHPEADFTYSSAFHTSLDQAIWDRQGWRAVPVKAVAPDAFLMQTMLAMYTLMQGMLLPREGLVEIGLFDSELDRCEDLDLLLRLGIHHRGVAVAGETFVFREHRGVRGSLGKEHAAAQRHRFLIIYRRVVFARLREKQALEHFVRHLDHGPDRPYDDATGREAAAFLCRAVIMLRQGVFEGGYDDLQSALAHRGFATLTASWIASMLIEAGSPEPWVFDSPLEVARRLGRVLNRHGQRPLARHLAQGGYWAARRALHRGAFGEASQASTFSGAMGAVATPVGRLVGLA